VPSDKNTVSYISHEDASLKSLASMEVISSLLDVKDNFSRYSQRVLKSIGSFYQKENNPKKVEPLWAFAIINGYE